MYFLRTTSWLFCLVLCASCVLATYVTFPLYIDPSNNAWQPLYGSIAANPNLTFNLIINPDSGPGATTYPDTNTIAGLARLNSYPNVNTLGYVHVTLCTRSLSDAQADVDKYAGWAKYEGGQDIHVSGIFFDEAPALYSSNDFSYMQTMSGYVKNTFPSSNNHVAFNPGAIADSQYFSIADSICIYEDSYSNYPGSLPSSIPVNQRAASTIIIYGFDGSQDQQTSIVQAVSGNEVAGLFITSATDYTTFPNLWSPFVKAMAEVAGSSPDALAPSSILTRTSTPATDAPIMRVKPSVTTATFDTVTTPQVQATTQLSEISKEIVADPVEILAAILPSGIIQSHHPNHWSSIQW